MSALIGKSQLEDHSIALADSRLTVKPIQGRPRVLVLLATFNGGKWIREQLDSILRQVGVDIRVVVNDDCSTDDTQAVLKSYSRDPRVKLTSSHTRSGSAAQNFFWLIRNHAADGFDFVALADQDDLWDGDKLHRACCLTKNNQFSGYSSAVIAIWDNGRKSLLKQEHAPTASDYLFEGAGQGCTFVLSTDFYTRLRKFIVTHDGLTRTLHYHDWAIYALARAWGLSWCFDSQPSMQYRQHGRNDTGARTSFRGIRRRLSLIRCGWYRTQLAIIAQLCAVGAPSNSTVAAWRSIFVTATGFKRKAQIAKFCLHGGRRRKLDSAVLLISALIGWI